MSKQKKENIFKAKVRQYKGITKQLSYPDWKTMLKSTAIVIVGSVVLSAVISLETAGVAELVKLIL